MQQRRLVSARRVVGSNMPTVGFMKSVMWWMRRDLRTNDNATLAAAASAGVVHPVVIIDERYPMTTRRWAWWASALLNIHRETGGVVIQKGNTVERLVEAARSCKAHQVYASADYGPYGMVRDALVEKALKESGIEYLVIDTPYVHDLGAIVNKDGSPIRTFAAWRRRWLEAGIPGPVCVPRVEWGTGATGDLSGGDLETLLKDVNSFGLEPDASESAQFAKMETFLPRLSMYPAGRDYPSRNATSGLSAGIRFGLVHPRSIMAAAGGVAGSEKLLDELCWREWYAALLRRNPAWAWETQQPIYANLKCETGEIAASRFRAWCAGETGYPLVDAGMRELLHTGYMHNRVRMVTASFLVKHLHLPWQWGARHFMKHLSDGDLASNNMSWQWVAGVGIDAAPWFRIMNPTAQAEKFDPDGIYIKTHIPELSDMGAGVHEPGAGGYAKVIVDHSLARAETVQRYKDARR